MNFTIDTGLVSEEVLLLRPEELLVPEPPELRRGVFEGSQAPTISGGGILREQEETALLPRPYAHASQERSLWDGARRQRQPVWPCLCVLGPVVGRARTGGRSLLAHFRHCRHRGSSLDAFDGSKERKGENRVHSREQRPKAGEERLEQGQEKVKAA